MLLDGEAGVLRFDADDLRLHAIGDHPGGVGHAVVRGEDVTLAREWPPSSSARNVLSGLVVEVVRDGALARVTVAIGRATLISVVTYSSAFDLGLSAGDSIVASIKATAVHIC